MALDKIVESLEEYLQYMKEDGIYATEVDPEVVKNLGKKSTRPPVPLKHSAVSVEAIEKIAKKISGCKKCALSESRTNTVPGEGTSNPEIMFIGEAPGADEDQQGLPFVGRAGKLLTKMIEAMGLSREEVFIGNILKCRPPDNRKPTPQEMEICIPYLKEQIKILQPKVIIALGATAVSGLIDNDLTISELRGNWMTFEGIDLMPTFHPAYILRKPSVKKEVWEDLKTVLKKLGKTIPPVKKK